MNDIRSAHRNLYWADSRLKRLEVALLDGRYRKQLVSTELGHPSAVAVNPRLGWDAFNSSREIKVAACFNCCSESLGCCTGLTVEMHPRSNVLGWTVKKGKSWWLKAWVGPLACQLTSPTMIEFTGPTQRKVASNLFCRQETIAEHLSS